MLSDGELTLWYERLRLSTAARLLIDGIRSSGPARRVRAAGRRVRQISQPKDGRDHSVRKPLRKTGRHLSDGARGRRS